MLGHSTYKEFARWREYLMSIIPSDSVDAQRSVSQKSERILLLRKKAHLQQVLAATNKTNGDRHQNEQAIVNDVHSGIEPMARESQLWDD